MRSDVSDKFEMAWGDVNIEYGGVWIKDQGEYADWVELTDLDSATGTRGMVLLEFGSVGLYGRTFADNLNRFRNAIQGMSLKGINHKNGRLVGWAQLRSYGYGDTDSRLVIRTDPASPVKQEGWEATITVETEDLPGYLRSVHDLEVQ
jgi:hypothetical protein